MAQSMRDPSEGIEGNFLIQHIHLVSANQYAAQARLDLQTVTKYLMAAPQISKDRAPFFWTYLNQPGPGTVILTWQARRLGVAFASDGYIWAPEQYHRQDLGNGLSIEIYFNRVGYRPGEQVANTARRRFRLVPSQQGNPNVPQIDLNLWIVHYTTAEQPDACSPNQLPYTPEIQNSMTTRNALQSCGAIERKEFMLSDRSKWPRIPEPVPQGGSQAPGQAPMYGPIGRKGGSVPMSQAGAYPSGPVPPRSRRAMAQGAAPGPQGSNTSEPVEEDQQDVFDVLTPRDIALARYQQNHEWMEEVASSAYSIHQIDPPELGLGLKGALAAVTDGVFNAPAGEAASEYPEHPYVGRLDAGKAEEFRKRAQAHIDSENAEIEKIKAEHAKVMAAFKASSAMGLAEKELRFSVEERGPEIWRLEGRTMDGDDGASSWSQKHNKKVDDIVAQVEAQLGRNIAALNEVSRIQDGGYQEPEPEPEPEPVPEPVKEPTPAPPAQPDATTTAPSDARSRQPSHAGSHNSGVMVDDNDIDMGGTAAGLLDQMHTGFSAGSTPLNFPTPQGNMSGLNSNAATPANVNVPSPAPNPPEQQQQQKKEGGEQDVSMGNTDASEKGGEQTGAGDDWVVVPKGGVSPSEGAGEGSGSGGDQPAQSSMKAPTSAAGAAAPKQASAAGTPAVTEGDANDFSSLGDLDTAGDALASYDTPGLDGAAGSLGDGLDLSMDMEDSAFGDAFHGVGNTGTPGGQSEGV